MLCGICKSNSMTTIARTFASGISGQEILCGNCGAHQKFVRSDNTWKNDNLLEERIPFGKYKGMTIREILSHDTNYAQWAADSLEGRWADKFRSVLSHRTGETNVWDENRKK